MKGAGGKRATEMTMVWVMVVTDASHETGGGDLVDYHRLCWCTRGVVVLE